MILINSIHFTTFAYVLKIFKSFTPQTIIILLLLAVAVKFYYFIYPPEYVFDNNIWGIQGLNKLLQQWFNDSPRLSVTMGIITIVLQSLIINRIAIVYKLFPSEGFIPAVLFILITSFLPEWNVVSLPMLAAWFILIPLNAMLRLPITSMPKKLLFNAGMSISIATLIYFPSVFHIIFLSWAMAIVHPFHWKNVAIVLLGFAAPIYLIASLYFLGNIPYTQFLLPAFEINIFHIPIGITILTTIIVLGLTVLASIYSLNNYIEKINEPSKKLWWVIIALAVVSGLAALYQMPFQSAGTYIMLIPLALLASNIWMNDSGKWLKISLFWIILLTALANQWYL